jgi:D,D-heptose 1,7-bisphosphate phosphatase
MKAKAVFLDKDGTLIPDIPYNIDPSRISLSEGAIEGLQLLQAKGYKLIVVSNQSGIARGYFTEQDLEKVYDKLRELCGAKNIELSGFYYCPHHPQGIEPAYSITCDCRKPEPGLIIKAARELNINIEGSWMVGDILNDVEAGNRSGCRTILIDNGNETEWKKGTYRQPELRAKNWKEAAMYIVKNSN